MRLKYFQMGGVDIVPGGCSWREARTRGLGLIGPSIHRSFGFLRPESRLGLVRDVRPDSIGVLNVDAYREGMFPTDAGG
jgi:hypothetical protein